MEEKERYKTIYHNYTNPEDNWMSIFDNETGKDLDNDADFEAITNLLNQQDKRIKELEQQLKETTIKLQRVEIVDFEAVVDFYKNKIEYYEQENQQLKQQLEDSKEKLKEYATEITRRNTEQLDMQTRSFLKIRDLETEILILKQQLHDLPKKIVGEIKDIIKTNYPYMTSIYDDNILFKSDLGIEMKSLSQVLDTILKKFGGENE